MGKIIFLDVDGTLVNYENQLPASAVDAIHKAKASGHLVYMCTGRSKAEVYPELWEIGLDGLIGGNGSYVESGGEVVFEQTLSLDEATRVVDWLKERGLEFYLESNNGLFGSENFITAGEPVIRKYALGKGAAGAEEATVPSVFPEMIFGAELYRDDLNKISFILKDYQDFLDAKAAFPELKAGTWGGVGELALFGDLGVGNISKAHAIDELLSYLGADQADTFAFGDAKVDIPMLEYCNVGVAMGNGGEEIKAMADYITDAVDEDGLYNAFVHFGLLE